MDRLIFLVNIFLLISVKSLVGFHVDFRHHSDIKVRPRNTQPFKRDILQRLDKASYTFNGFQKINSVPVIFPLDICLMHLNEKPYAATLYINKNGVRSFAIYAMINDTYNIISDMPTPLALTIDCRGMGDKGYIALAFNKTTPVTNTLESSPVYVITGNRLRAVQYFASANLASIFLQKSADELYMLQTFRNTNAEPNLQCPYFKWTGTTFKNLGSIPCSNARHLEAFAMDYEIYVAVANYADHYGHTSTNSEIYKYSRQLKRFILFQRIRTQGAVDVKYFNVPLEDGVRQKHFLIFGNSIGTAKSKPIENANKNKREGQNMEADSVFYVYDKGQFVPYQKLTFFNVQQFLPIKSKIAEKFLLLVACANQDTKIFNLNDWKFEESDVQFTDGALGKGVSKMRVFTTPANSYLVVANELMLANETNTYLPIFKQDERAKLLRQEMIEWTKHNIERLASIDILKLQQDVEHKLAEYLDTFKPLNFAEIPESHIQTASTESFIYPRLKFGKHFWKALTFAKKAIDELEFKMQEQAVREKRESHKRNSKNKYEFERLNVGTLLIKDKLKAQKINGYSIDKAELREIKAKKVIVTDEYEPAGKMNNARISSTSENETEYKEENEEIMNLDNLQIKGKLNEYTWNNLVENTLKRRAPVQFIKAPVDLKNLEVDTIAVSSDTVSGQNLAKLIQIDGGSYVVDQSITFAAPVNAKSLIIHERLNNVHVFKNQFDVLLKHSNTTQVIKGSKRFDNIKVLEPITLSGQVMGKHLLAMAPSKAIHDSIFLNGDYTIMGDVIITKLFSAVDIIDGKTQTSAKDKLQSGLQMKEILKNININFEKPIAANSSMVSFINAQDLQQLVQTNTNEVQVVEGDKLFKGSLEIKQGFSEVKNLNGVNIEELEKRLFLRDTNQTITVPMEFEKILVKSIHAPQVTLNAKNLSDFLTKTGKQHILGALKVQKLKTNTLQTEDLHTNGKIFDKPLSEIYQQKAKSVPDPNVFQNKRKFHGSIYVKNLKLISTINGMTIDRLEQQLTQLDGNIKYVGDIKFNYDMLISNLSFNGKFNGIPAEQFGKTWLQKYGEQNFTAAQTISSVQCERGVLLEDKLNGYKVDDFMTGTYWINRYEHIARARFESPIQLQGALLAKTVNNMLIPQDVLYRNSAQAQVLTHPLTVHGDLYVEGHISNTTAINGLNLLHLDNYLKGFGADTLYVEHASFDHEPAYRTLNRHDLQQTLDAVWLANENIDLQQHIEISEGNFEGLLEFEGPINNINLKYLRDNYLSISRPQQISTEIIFSKTVKFEKDLYADEMNLFGSVVESKSKSRIIFDEFVANTLKTSGPHNISGQWSMLEAIIQGNLHKVLVNQLNLATDVVRHDVLLNNIAAPKRINAVSLEKLYVTPRSLVNAVNIVDWLRDTVFVYENYTILGTTALDTINMYNDLLVDGSVDNITFDEHTLLLREHEQILRGPVRIRNKFNRQQRILTNNFENLRVDAVNGWEVKQFFDNQVKMGTKVHVQGALVFNNPLLVTEFRSGDGNIYRDWRDKRRINNDFENITAAGWSKLEHAVRILRKSYVDTNYILEDFQVRQTLQSVATNLISLPLRLNKDFIDVIGISNDTKEEHLQFYSWDKNTNQFHENQNLSWLPHKNLELDVLNLAFRRDDYLQVAKTGNDASFQQNIITNNTEGLERVLKMKNIKNSKLECFEMQNEDCFAIYSYESDEVALYCLEHPMANAKLEIAPKGTIKKLHVKQILALSADSIALLFDDAVEIWNTSSSLELVQRIALVKPKQIAVGLKNNVTYLGVISETTERTLHCGTVELYSARYHTHFTHLQTINCIHPLQIEFSQIQQSSDLLLHILSASYEQPLMVYQYKGVAGFEQIVAASTLPTAKRIVILQMRSTQQHLIALLGEQEITFVEIKLKTI